MSETTVSQEQYHDLLTTIFGKKKKPAIGKKPSTVGNFQKNLDQEEAIHILGIITNEVTIPKMDGNTAGEDQPGAGYRSKPTGYLG